ncbi:MAG: ATP-dependent helicase [Acidimicrobiia bacterium]|nr:ATP-dependent helicase [Acidimicrobiia bacterium]
MFDWLQGLNDRQREAVEYDGGPLLVVAGAGTGKTRTLTARVARLIATGTAADRVLLLTFSRRAATEMLGRARSLVGPSAGRVWGGTFHAVANRLLREHGAAVGVDPCFGILDQADAGELMDLVRVDLGAGLERRFPRKDTLVAIYSRTVNSQVRLAQVLEESFPWCREDSDEIAAIFRAYGERKREHALLDYDDLLLYWRALLGTPRGDVVRRQFDHVLVDEYQDTNEVQGDILFSLCGPAGNVCAVGDDAQAIYAFRAASPKNMYEFPVRYPSARVVTLDQNYRSTQPILDAANAVLAQSPGPFAKRLWAGHTGGTRPVLATCSDEAAQAGYVCDSVLWHRDQGVALREQAVLFRAGHHSDGLELELARRNIPFVKYGGLRYLEAAHVKDLLCLLRVLDNPRDEVAWHRALCLLPGVGPATARRVVDDIDVRSGEALHRFLDAPPRVPTAVEPPLAELRAALADAHGQASVGTQVGRLRTFCAGVFEHRYPDADARLGDLERLEAVAARSDDRARFLADLALDPPASTGDLAGAPHLDDDWLVLSTIHSAKGCEWPVVHVIHASDGNIPADMALSTPDGLDEERRLLYVALTRARHSLVVSAPLRYYHRRRGFDDAHSYGQLSRFLMGEAGAAFDPVSVDSGDGELTTDSALAAEPAPDPVVGALEALWQ